MPIIPQELKPLGSTNMQTPLSKMRASLMIMPLRPMFLNKPSFDDEEVIDNFDSGFDDDLEAIFDNFVGVVSILPAEYRVTSPP